MKMVHVNIVSVRDTKQVNRKKHSPVCIYIYFNATLLSASCRPQEINY